VVPRWTWEDINPQTSPYCCSDWDLCRAWRARSLLFSRPTESFNWNNPVVVLSRSGVNCVNSAWSRSSRSSTVASRLGPGGGRVFSFSGLGGVSSFIGSSSVVTGAAGRLLIIGDRWRAVMSSIWKPASNAARVMAFLITGRMTSTYWGKQSLSTTWPSLAKQSILCAITGYGKTSWNPHRQKWRRKCASTCSRRARCDGRPSRQTWQIWRGPLGPQASSIFFFVADDTHLCHWRSTTGSPRSISSPSSIGSGGSWSCDLELVVRVWSERIQQCKWLYTEVPPAYTA